VSDDSNKPYHIEFFDTGNDDEWKTVPGGYESVKNAVWHINNYGTPDWRYRVVSGRGVHSSATGTIRPGQYNPLNFHPDFKTADPETETETETETKAPGYDQEVLYVAGDIRIEILTNRKTKRKRLQVWLSDGRIIVCNESGIRLTEPASRKVEWA
jgi:hypothetical protein